MMKKVKSPLLKFTKETPEARKKRVSSGVVLRAAVFEDRRKRLQEKTKADEQDEQY
jgi:hypothetical protein